MTDQPHILNKNQRDKRQYDCDVLVIGGGINGCGIARELCGHGLSVCLVEMRDLASGTSSWSSKLVHGGLRYLEHYAFRLVREALAERQTLMDMAPHLIEAKRFILPFRAHMRPKWMLRAGLFLYDHLDMFAAKTSSTQLKGARQISLRSSAQGQPLKSDFRTGFEYGDCFVDDTRLTIINAQAAAELGATILTRKKINYAEPCDTGWIAGGDDFRITAKSVVNATGPWADRLLSEVKLASNRPHIRLVQGSHIIVDSLFDHGQPYILQHHDNRIVFALPYLGKYTLLGTTDTDFDGDPADAEITASETEYILEVANSYFKKQLCSEDVIATYSGVRPLYDDGTSEAQTANRDYRLEWHHSHAGWLNIFGGKLTTYRCLSVDVAQMICTRLSHTPNRDWKSDSPLPGGDITSTMPDYYQHLAHIYPGLDQDMLKRIAKNYGSRATLLLGDAASQKDLGTDFGAGLTKAEVDYLMRHEWAEEAEDILWRRTKLGYDFTDEQVKNLNTFMQNKIVEAE